MGKAPGETGFGQEVGEALASLGWPVPDYDSDRLFRWAPDRDPRLPDSSWGFDLLVRPSARADLTAPGEQCIGRVQLLAGTGCPRDRSEADVTGMEVRHIPGGLTPEEAVSLAAELSSLLGIPVGTRHVRHEQELSGGGE